MSKTHWIISVFAITLIGVSFSSVDLFIASSREGLGIVFTHVLPVLFPFFFFVALLGECNFWSRSPRFINAITRRLYRIENGGAIALFGFLGGYPTSSKMIADSYRRGNISRLDAVKLSTLTSSPSPIFTIATVGTSLFLDIRLGIIIFASCVLGALLNGFFYRGIKSSHTTPLPHTHPVLASQVHPSKLRGELNSPIKTISATTQPSAPPPQSVGDIISNALSSALSAILSVCGLVIIFFIFTSQLGELANLPTWADILVSSLIEMTSGVVNISTGIPNHFTFARVVLATAVLAFGGFCIAMQSFLFLRKFDVSFKFYIAYKTTHTILAVGVAVVLGLLFL